MNPHVKLEEIKGGRFDGAWRATYGCVTAYADTKDEAHDKAVAEAGRIALADPETRERINKLIDDFRKSRLTP